MRFADMAPGRAWFMLIALCLAGCGGPSGKGVACYPAAAKRWIYVKADPKQPNGDSVATSATIYMDRSGSMTGYIEGKTAFEKPFQDLIDSVPAGLGQIKVKAGYRAFGRTISEPLAKPAVLNSPGFYQCANRNLSLCENQESHLDAVFGRIRNTPDEMAVIVSDLWFTNSDIQSSGWTALQPLLADILQSGRTIAVYGIDAPFRGRISDLPDASGKLGSIAFTGRKPLFLIVVGSKVQVLALDEQLQNSGSKLIATGMRNKTIHRSIFTVDPGPVVFAVKKPLSPGNDPRIRPSLFEASAGVTIQQFEMKRGTPRPVASRPVPPSWTAPNDSSFVTDAVWQGPVEPMLRIWVRRDENCLPNSWLELSASRDGVEPVGNGLQQRVTLSPERLTGKMRQPGSVYFVTGELRRTSVTSPNPANRWMLDWSLAPERASATATRPPRLFPTLNLDEVSRLMENALATAAKRAHEDGSNDVVAGFSAMVKVEN